MRAWANRDLHGGGAMPPPRAHALIEVDGRGRRRRLLRAPRVDDGRLGLRDLHVDQRVHPEEIAPYPDRMYLECNVGPILRAA
jgi:hypothetical protein